MRSWLAILLVFILAGSTLSADVRSFGAKGDGQTDDTAALQAVYVSSHAGDTITIPPGTYLFTKPLFWTGKDVDFAARRATLRWAGGPGVAITVGGVSGQTLGNIRLDGLRITRSANWVEDTTALVVQNLQTSDLRIEMCGNFRRGLVIRGDNGGCAYNRIQVATHNCQIGLTIQTAGTGWCNRNTIYDSSFMVSANAPSGDAVMLLLPDGTYPTGGWTVRDTSFQSSRSTTAIRVEQRGQLILDGCWFETIGAERLLVDIAPKAFEIRSIRGVEARGFGFSDRTQPRVLRTDFGWIVR